MTEEHPNVTVIKSFVLGNLEKSCIHLADDFCFHFFKPSRPDLQGSYRGIDGLKTFFTSVASITGGTFKTKKLSVEAFGNELVVTHCVNTFMEADAQVSQHGVLVWRFRDGKIVEAWDIPSEYALDKVGLTA